MLTFFFCMWGVSLTHPVVLSFLCGEFLLYIPCCVDFYARSFSYTSCAGFFSRFFFFFFFFLFFRGVSLTHPMLASLLSGDFLLHIPCWLHFYLGSFSDTSHAGFIFMWGVSLTHPVLASLLSGEFLLHISCLFYFSVGSFSYTSQAGFFFKRRVSLTHPMLY